MDAQLIIYLVMIALIITGALYFIFCILELVKKLIECLKNKKNIKKHKKSFSYNLMKHKDLEAVDKFQ